MGIPEWIAIISVVVAFLSLAAQQHWTRQHAKADALIKICESNRELLALGIGNPRLLGIIGSDDLETEIRRRYCQLWTNQVELMFRLRRPLSFLAEHWQGTKSDMRGFMEIPSMRSHWEANRHYYGADFQRFVDHDLYGKDRKARAEAPPNGAPANVDQAPTT